MNPSFYRRDRTNQEMGSSSLTASLLLLSLVFMQFVSAADQNNVTIFIIKAEPGENLILPCKDPDQREIRVVEWSRTDLGSEYVLRYRDKQLDPGVQHPSYKNRADLLVGQMKVGDASLILRNAATDDSGTYECRLVPADLQKKLISTIHLHVAPPAPPEPFPVWAKVLLVLLVLLGLVAAGVSVYFWLHSRPETKPQEKEEVKVASGQEFVLLPFKMSDQLPGDIKVKWKDGDNRTVHVFRNGSDQPGEQDQIYRTRTKMDKNLVKNGDLSLTLSWPSHGDENSYSCRVSSWRRNIVWMKQVLLKVKAQQVKVKSGVESVLLPCRTTESLDGDVGVVWRDGDNEVVHVYQNGSDCTGIVQNPSYRTRTKMDENLLKTGDLSLTLKCPTVNGLYTCRVFNKTGKVLMEKKVDLWFWYLQVEVEEGAESVQLEFRATSDLRRGDRVEWKDSRGWMVHVNENGSDRAEEQNQFYRGRTKMAENLLENKDLSLTLIRPTERDSGEYRCEVLREGIPVTVKHFHLEVKVQQVEVKSGEDSVLLPCRTTEDLDGDVGVEWMDKDNRKVHVYQNGSDQPGEQDEFYRTRTKMEENLLKTKDLSLTLRRPTERDSNTFTCRVYRGGDVLMEKQVQLEVKAGTVQVQVQPEDIRTRTSAESTPLMANQLV